MLFFLLHLESLKLAGICSETWNIVINVTKHWLGKSRKLEIAKCRMLLGRCYFAVHHKYNTEMLPLVTYTCCHFYAHKKDLKRRRKPNNTIFIILILFFSPLKGRIFLLTFKTTQDGKATQHIPANTLWKRASLCTHMKRSGRFEDLW